VFAHKNLFAPLLGNRTEMRQPPLVFRLFEKLPALRRIPARWIGLGFRPEHIRTPAGGERVSGIHGADAA
jgi:hypothetical protein